MLQSFSRASGVHAKYCIDWQFVRFRDSTLESRMERREISAKMDASTASRIIRMELFSEHAEAAQELCAERAVFRLCIEVYSIVRLPFSEMVQEYHRRLHFSRETFAIVKRLCHATKFCRPYAKKIVKSAGRSSGCPVLSIIFKSGVSFLGHLQVGCPILGHFPGLCPYRFCKNPIILNL